MRRKPIVTGIGTVFTTGLAERMRQRAIRASSERVPPVRGTHANSVGDEPGRDALGARPDTPTPRQQRGA